MPRTAGQCSGRTLAVDPTFGVAGDMLLAAMLDAGADEVFVRRCVEAVLPGTVELRVGRGARAGMAASTVDVVLLRDDQPHRPWREVRSLIEVAGACGGLPELVRDTALRVFTELAEAEGTVHGLSADEVHFHEVGAWDSIADVVGVCAALHSLDIDRVETLPVSVGTGTVRAAHGLMPVPVPAVLELLTRSGLPWQPLPPGADSADAHEHGAHEHVHSHGAGSPGGERTRGHGARPGELATPTGVAVLAALAESPEPTASGAARRTVASGVGAGRKDFGGWPNVVRVAVLDAVPDVEAQQIHGADGTDDGDGDSRLMTERLRVLEANLDDVDPRVWPSVLESLLQAGARDAWLTPLLGKKGRAGHMVSVLVEPDVRDVCLDLLLDSTGTLGVREHEVLRHALPRAWKTVTVLLPGATPDHVRVKYGHRHGVVAHATPEYEDCAAIAQRRGVPVLHVLEAARAAAEAAGLRPGAPHPTPPRVSRD